MNEHLNPAFPTAVHNGMSLRDYFAAKALQGMAANGAFGMHQEVSIDDVCNDAYMIADAMLEARK